MFVVWTLSYLCVFMFGSLAVLAHLYLPSYLATKREKAKDVLASEYARGVEETMQMLSDPDHIIRPSQIKQS